MYTYVHMYISTLYTCIRICTYICVHICIYRHIKMQAFTKTYTHIDMYTYMQNTCIHRCIDTYMRMYLMVTCIVGARRARRFHSQDAKMRCEQPAAALQHRDTVTMRAAPGSVAALQRRDTAKMREAFPAMKKTFKYLHQLG